MKIGIAGTGRMGTAIARRLMGFGHEVTVWNRTAEKTRALAAAGAKVAATPAQLASASEIVITILTDAQAIDAVYLGRDALLGAQGPANDDRRGGSARLPAAGRRTGARMFRAGRAGRVRGQGLRDAPGALVSARRQVNRLARIITCDRGISEGRDTRDRNS